MLCYEPLLSAEDSLNVTLRTLMLSTEESLNVMLCCEPLLLSTEDS